MATTDPVLAATLLDALEATGISYAVLHGESDIAGGSVGSDIDVAVAVDAAEAALRVADSVAGSGVGPVLVWPYDAGAVTTFWMTGGLASGVQLDLVHDPDGRGRYGVRTEVLLRHIGRGQRWMRVSPEAERLYLISKRWMKADSERLGELATATASDRAAELGREVLSERALRRVDAALRGRRPARRVSAFGALHGRLSARGWSRFRDPIGVLVRVKGSPAEALPAARRLQEAFAPVVVRAELTGGRSPLARARRALIRRRPAVLVTAEDVGRPPDLVVSVGHEVDLESVTSEVWSGLVTRACRRLERMAGAISRP